MKPEIKLCQIVMIDGQVVFLKSASVHLANFTQDNRVMDNPKDGVEISVKGKW